jgi:beta-N-acetylhexosaminidase
MQAVVDAVRSGEIPEARINESVMRILRAKQQFGVMAWAPLDPASAAVRVNTEAHTQLIDELFRSAVTVAYDRNNQIPITPDRRTAIIFLATRYQIQHECSTYDPNIRWVGVSDEPSLDEIGWARAAADWADTVVVFTQDAVRTPAQRDLVNALPAEKTIAVALLSPYDWLHYPQVSAYVASYSAWRPSVPAICAVLFGALPANGQFPLTLGPELPAGSRAN